MPVPRQRHLLEAERPARDHWRVEAVEETKRGDAVELLERTSELSQLHQCATEAADTRSGRVALLFGEAGIGKTALLRRFRSTLPRRFTVLWGACDPLFTPRPLGPLLGPAEQLGGELAALVAGEASPHDVAGALLAGLRGCAPSVLVLDDLQWCDEATLDVVRLLARRLESAGTLVLLSFRDDSLHRTHPLGLVLGEMPPHVVSARLGLSRLSLGAVRGMARGTSLNPEALHSRTGGNPFFVTEALAAGTTAVPATVRDAVLARIARLTRPPATCSMRSRSFRSEPRYGCWRRCPDGDLSALDECLQSGVLRAEADGVVFRHELARLAVEEAAPPNRSVALHRLALAALTANELGVADPARLAHHAEAAADTAAVLRHAPASRGASGGARSSAGS